MEKPTRAKPRARRNNPWEILALAALFFFPGLFMLFHDGAMIAIQQSFRWAPSRVTAVSEDGARMFGLLAIGVSAVCVWFYFYLRRAIARDKAIEKRRWR